MATASDDQTVKTWYITDVNSVEESSVAAGYALYPNPTDNVVYLTLDGETASHTPFLLHNVLGQKVAEYTLEAGQNKYVFDLNHLPAGMYIATFNHRMQKLMVR